jgi:IS30 family transposase
MLARKRGASIAQIEKTLSWQPHTIRAEISRLRKTGAEVMHDRSVSPPVYRIVTAAVR